MDKKLLPSVLQVKQSNTDEEVALMSLTVFSCSVRVAMWIIVTAIIPDLRSEDKPDPGQVTDGCIKSF